MIQSDILDRLSAFVCQSIMENIDLNKSRERINNAEQALNNVTRRRL